MVVVCVICVAGAVVWSLVSVALGLLLGRCIAVGQGRDAQRQAAWSPDPALAGLFATAAGRERSAALGPAAPDLPAQRQPEVPAAERV